MNRNKFLKLFGVGVIAAPVVAKAALEVKPVLEVTGSSPIRKTLQLPKQIGMDLYPVLSKEQMYGKKDWPIGLVVWQRGESCIRFWNGDDWAKLSNQI